MRFACRITKGTLIVQADSGSDSDSESRLQSAQSVVQADSVSDSDSESRLHSAQSVVQADSGSDSNSETRRQSVHRMSFVGGAIQTVLSQTIYRNDFLILFPTLGIGVGTWICLHYTRTLRQEYKHTLIICNTQCFSTATVVTAHPSVTLHVHCLICIIDLGISFMHIYKMT